MPEKDVLLYQTHCGEKCFAKVHVILVTHKYNNNEVFNSFIGNQQVTVT